MVRSLLLPTVEFRMFGVCFVGCSFGCILCRAWPSSLWVLRDRVGVVSFVLFAMWFRFVGCSVGGMYRYFLFPRARLSLCSLCSFIHVFTGWHSTEVPDTAIPGETTNQLNG